MSVSQNGWSTISSAQTRKYPIPGTDRHLILRDGNAGFVLTHLALFFHEQIERLDLGIWDDWGFSFRPVTGGTVYSNHASGTAADLNATRHPYGVSTEATFTPQQARKIRRVLRLRYLGLIRWGGDYRSTQDGMHFEIVGTPRQIRLLARILRHTGRGRKVRQALRT